jgi:hypothetical protein
MTALLFLATAADAVAQGALPLAVSRSTEAFKDRRISESSGVVASRAFRQALDDERFRQRGDVVPDRQQRRALRGVHRPGGGTD